MSFAIGTEVVVKTLADRRGVIIQAAPDGRYRVRLESVTVWCRESDIAAPPPRKPRKSRDGPKRDGPADPRPGGGSLRPGRVDLHGLTVEEALVRLLDEVERAIVRGADRVEVVHGKGSGRVRHAVHQRLASIASVKSFKLDDHNAGITWVFL
jgi:DNA mismatch repair protein MutS2